MKPECHTVAQMYERLQVMIRQRNDTGFRLAISDAVLEPKNPFEPKKRRRPKGALAVAIGLFLVLALIFVYFSFQKGR
jgi:hypothetical protein